MKNSTATSQQQIRPFVPAVALLSEAELAFQASVSAYVFVACSGILIWDILNNLKDDYALLRNYRIRLPTITYFLSRFSSLGYILMSTVFQTAQITNCKVFQQRMAWLYTAAIATISLLFTLRVKAIYGGNKYVTAFFGLLWIVVLGGCLTTTQGDTEVKAGPSSYCTIQHFSGYVASSAIAPLVNDTLVFFAISWRLMQNAHVGDGCKFSFRTMVLGHHMLAFSRTLLKDGQLYYLTTITTSLLTAIMLFIDRVPSVYRTMFGGPNVMLMNIMACRVFRKTRLGIIVDNTVQTITPEQQTGVINRRDDAQVSPIVFSKQLSRGNFMDGIHNITIDFSTEESGIEALTTTERLQDFSRLDHIERGLGA